MSVFTTVAPEQADAYLRRYSIGSLTELTAIRAGIENTNYFLSTGHGQYVLTLFERLGRAELPFYVHLMAHLARQGIPCPAPIADRGNETLGTLNGKPALIVTRLRGAPIEHPAAAHCAKLGTVLARMHVAARTYGERRHNPRGSRWRRAAAREMAPFLDPDERALLAAESRYQAAFRPRGLPRGVVHGDLFRDNVLFDESRIGGVIDFYFAGRDALLFDLAVCANDWCASPARTLDRERVSAMLNAYHAGRPLAAAEAAAWSGMLRAAALRFWLSRLCDRRAPRAGELVLAKDPVHFRDILALRAGATGDVPWL